MQTGVMTASNYQWQDTTHERHSHPFYYMPKIMCMLSALLLASLFSSPVWQFLILLKIVYSKHRLHKKKKGFSA